MADGMPPFSALYLASSVCLTIISVGGVHFGHPCFQAVSAWADGTYGNSRVQAAEIFACFAQARNPKCVSRALAMSLLLRRWYGNMVDSSNNCASRQLLACRHASSSVPVASLVHHLRSDDGIASRLSIRSEPQKIELGAANDTVAASTTR